MNVKKFISDELDEIKTKEQFDNLVYAIANKVQSNDHNMEYAQLLYILAYEIMGASGFWMEFSYDVDFNDTSNIMLYLSADCPNDNSEDIGMYDFIFDLGDETYIDIAHDMLKGIIKEREGKWSYSSTDSIGLSAFSADVENTLPAKTKALKDLYLKELLKTSFAMGIEDIIEKNSKRNSSYRNKSFILNYLVNI